ncbi:MAG: hypothetical protein D6748_02440 [Calditrichaeota bacterium]|nr:MAG: hypothetical protein D6748_02440 [Calditrichota bacterium]
MIIADYYYELYREDKSSKNKLKDEKMTSFEFIESTPLRTFEFVLEHYFRVSFPASLEKYCQIINQQSAAVREHLARVSPYPDIIELLVNDRDPWVRNAARNNPYWQFVGQYKALLKMTAEDKLQFVEREDFRSLLVFIIYETDIRILKGVFENPTISLQMLTMLKNYLIQRGVGDKDGEILQLVENIISVKKQRLVKVATIHSESNQHNPETSIAFILQYLLDEDPIVVECIVNAMEKYSISEFEQWLFQPEPFEAVNNTSAFFLWQILIKLRELISAVRTPNKQKLKLLLQGHPETSELILLIKRRMILLLEKCANNLDDEDCFVTLVNAYLERDPEILECVTQVLTLEELFSLITDESFSSTLATRALQILKHHPSSKVKQQLAEIFVLLHERARKRLKEMEMSINAIFDIITSYVEEIGEAFPSLNIDHLQSFQFLYENIRQLIELPYSLFTHHGEVSSPSEEADENFQKAKIFWKATIGQYLGRLKELDELLQSVWLLILPKNFSHLEFLSEINATLRDLELAYKQRVGCHLRISCQGCLKRTCAAERFLLQNEFFLAELNDFLEEEILIKECQV